MILTVYCFELSSRSNDTDLINSPLSIHILTVLSILLSPWLINTIHTRSQCDLGVLLFRTMSKSPTAKFCFLFAHFVFGKSVGRYSNNHLFQKRLV